MEIQLKNNENLYLTAAEVGKIIGLSTSRVYQLSSDGVFSTVAHGGKRRYFLPDVNRAYAALLEKRAEAKQTGKAGNVDAGDTKARIAAANAAYKERKAEMAALELARMKDELIPAEEVEFVMTDLVLKMKAQWDAFRNRAPMILDGITTKAGIYDVIGREIDAVLNEMAEYRYDPEDFKRHKAALDGAAED